MKVTLHLFGQALNQSKNACTDVDVGEGITVGEAAASAFPEESDPVRAILLTDAGRLSGSVLTVVDDKSIQHDQLAEDGMVISLYTPLSGG